MKTKLLRKFRAKAKKAYWIEYHPSNNYPYWVKTFDLPKDVAIAMYKSKKEAITWLEVKRREFILEQLVKKLDD